MMLDSSRTGLVRSPAALERKSYANIDEVPQIVAATDVIVRTSTAALCGRYGILPTHLYKLIEPSSELHRYRGHSKVNMEPGYVCGHEGIGFIHEVGSGVQRFKIGDPVVAPFTSSW